MTATCIQYLPIGTRFRLACDPQVTGTLTGLSDCSAAVRLHGAIRDVQFENEDGTTRRFRAATGRTTTWALATLVEPVSPALSPKDEEFCTMPKSATKKPRAQATKKTAAPAKRTPSKKPRDAKADGKLSALDAAAKVLAEAKAPLNTKQMIEQMAAKGYWTSPGGKTPHATLYSAILREIDTKGAEARFKKTDRGTFALKP